MKRAASSNDLLMERLVDLCCAEMQWKQLLPSLAQASLSTALKNIFDYDLEVTEKQLVRLQNIYGDFRVDCGGMICCVIKDLGLEIKDTIHHTFAGTNRDGALMGLSRRIKHFTIEEYAIAREHAASLRRSKITEVLDQILNEERAVRLHLSELAQKLINAEATRPRGVY